MRVLLVGSGGREHTLAWKISQSPLLEKLIWTPGNGGPVERCEKASVPADDIGALVRLARTESSDLVVVGPEAPLAEGLADSLEEHGIPCFGPCSGAARLESSKVFTKEFCGRHGIPTAPAECFDDADEALRWLEAREEESPLVLKADGLAAGKGVLICRDRESARQGILTILEEKAFGDAGDRMLAETFLEGREASLMCFCDGERIAPMPPARDYKRAFDDDRGPNTGGMGCYSPAEHVPPGLRDTLVKTFLEPAVRGIAKEGHPFRGVLYAGLMLTEDGPSLLEYNCRFGDPETQVVVPRLDQDILPLLFACAKGEMENMNVSWKAEAAITVVLAAEGYPSAYRKGMEIHGLERAAQQEAITVFHAGTRGERGVIRTHGGRVLSVTAMANDLPAARERVYRALRHISFEGVRFRSDIGRI